MKAIDFPEANVTFHRNKKDPNQDGKVYDLRVCQTVTSDGQGVCVIAWKPDEKELKLLATDKDAKFWILLYGGSTKDPETGEMKPIYPGIVPHNVQVENPFRTDGENYPDFVPLVDMPVPSALEQSSPLYLSIWNAIKNWTIRAPEYYGGYNDANGGHVKIIMDGVWDAFNKRMEEITASCNNRIKDMSVDYLRTLSEKDEEISRLRGMLHKMFHGQPTDETVKHMDDQLHKSFNNAVIDKMKNLTGELDKYDENGNLIAQARGLSKQNADLIREANNRDLPVENLVIVTNNSDAFRHWVMNEKKFKIKLLEHQTGVYLPKDVSESTFFLEWIEYEEKNNPKYGQTKKD